MTTSDRELDTRDRASSALLFNGWSIGWCRSCNTHVMPWLDVDAAGQSLTRCVHCDDELDEASLRPSAPDELTELGYRLEPSSGGCGSGGCSTR